MRHEYYIFKSIDYIYEAIEKRSKGGQLFEGYEFFLASKKYHMKTEEV